MPSNDKNPPKILLDLRILQGSDAQRGIGHYTAGLTKALVRLAQSQSKAEFAFLQDTERESAQVCSDLSLPIFKIGAENRKNLKKKIYNLFSNTAAMYDTSTAASLWNADLLHIASPLHGPFQWRPAQANCMTTATVYDLIPLEKRQGFIDQWPEEMQQLYFNRLKKIESLDGFVTISESAAKSLHTYCDIDYSCICIAYPGLREPFASFAEPAIPIDKRFGFLSFMSENPSKNSLLILQAYEQLDSQFQFRHPLHIIVPSKGSAYNQNLKSKLNQMRLTEKVNLIEGADDQTLLESMNKVRTFILPSTHEGFGLPVIESAACGMLVLASDISVLREVMQSGAWYFDPLSADELANAMRRTGYVDKETISVVEAGLKRSHQFNWDKTARQVWGYFLKILERNNRI